MEMSKNIDSKTRSYIYDWQWNPVSFVSKKQKKLEASWQTKSQSNTESIFNFSQAQASRWAG